MRLVVDSAAQLDWAILRSFGAKIVHFRLMVNGDPFEGGLEMSEQQKAEFCTLLRDKTNVVMTTGLKVADLVEVYRPVDGEPLVAIHVGHGFSAASHVAIRGALDTYPGADITIIDTAQTAAGLGVQVLLLLRAARDGAGPAELVSLSARHRPRTVNLGAICDLSYLARTGRIGRGRALLGNLLGLIPLLAVRGEEGSAAPVGRVRTPKQANLRFIELIRMDLESARSTRITCLISYFGPRANEAEELRALLVAQPWSADVTVCHGNPSSSVHFGPDYWEIGYTVLED